jgi:sigma-E factor negative regulatory protein RseC
MIEQQAVVARVVDNQAWLEATELGCSGCKSPCASAATRKLPPVVIVGELKPGQRVMIGVTEGLLVKASLQLYLLPLFGFFAGALIGDQYRLGFAPPWQELWTAIAGLGGLLTVLTLIRLAHAREAARPPSVSIRRVR